MADAFLNDILSRGPEPEPFVEPTCAYVEDMASRLQKSLDQATSATRCSHVMVSLELSCATEFVLEMNSVDSTLLDAQCVSLDSALHMTTELLEGGKVRRAVGAHVVTDSQPDNSVVHQAVADHIARAIGQVDDSTWIARGATRSNEGWNMTYACRSSMAEWVHATTDGKVSQYKPKIVDNAQDRDVLRQGV